MSVLFSHFCAWCVNALVLSFVVYVAYCVLRRLLVRSVDRYLFLKLTFLTLPILPSVSLLFELMGERRRGLGDLSGFASLETSPVSHSVFVSPHPSYTFAWVLLGAFALYAFVLCIKLSAILRSALTLHRIAQSGREVDCIHVMSQTSRRLPGGVRVIVHSEDMPPGTVRVLNPVILIPSKVYVTCSSGELALIIKHELQHVERRDSFFNGVRLGVRAALWFSPFVGWLARYFEEEMELSCDELLMSDPELEKKKYGTLLASLAVGDGFVSSPVLSGFLGSESFIIRRIEAMKMFKGAVSRRKSVVFVSSLLTVGSVFGLSAMGMDSKTNLSLPPSINLSLLSPPTDRPSAECETGKCSAEFLATYDRARSGDADAENQLGEMYLFGRGVARDYQAAMVWFLKASEQGHPVAPNHIGRLYLNGEGVAQNAIEACVWYTLSAERGDSAGQHNANWCRQKHDGIDIQARIEKYADIVPPKKLMWSADRTFNDRERKAFTLTGNVFVREGQFQFRSDSAVINYGAQTIVGEGDCRISENETKVSTSCMVLRQNGAWQF